MRCLTRHPHVVVTLFALSWVDCGCRPERSAIMISPVLTIHVPKINSHFKRNERIDVSGSVVAASPAWKPEVVVIKVYDAVKTNVSLSGYSIKPVATQAEHEYKFAANLKVPDKPGEYLLKVLCRGAGDSSSPLSKTNKEQSPPTDVLKFKVNNE